ncbi:hypothetical protein B7P43_G07560 [Cryptotermes secundus]|uniref:Uncharacterized protein n=1 Tax=Cryptotermes secundus TaxID=105785 RepID=A0A2J7QHU8_9NEOP|nr:hypothetical protein B7P43_G07560 [Cryptotermes secundus]
MPHDGKHYVPGCDVVRPARLHGVTCHTITLLMRYLALVYQVVYIAPKLSLRLRHHQ